MTVLDDLYFRRPLWHAHAACRGKGADLFFPTKAEHDKIRAAKALCAFCPVRRDCADAGQNELYGIWGGQPQDHRIRREWNVQ